MFRRIFSISVLVVFVFAGSLQAQIQDQKKIGVFIHGFNGGSEKWTEGEVPSEWKGDILDDVVLLDYETEELRTENQTALVQKFVSKMLSDKSRSKSDKWILIGHSLGGIIARELYPAFKQYGFNVVAVVSVGGPSQGAMATDVDKDFVDKTISDMKDVMNKAYLHRRSYIDLGVAILDLINGSENGERIDSLPSYISAARDTALGLVDDLLENEANDIIGVEGRLIKSINSYPKGNSYYHPQNYLSIIGAEKDKAPIRMAGYIYPDIPELKDEYEMINQVQKLRNDYFKRHEDYYHNLYLRYRTSYYACLALRFGIGCSPSTFQYARTRRDIWSAAKREIDNLGNTWAELINSYRIKTISYTTKVLVCDSRPKPGDVQFANVLYALNEEEDCWYDYQTVYNDVLVADKNDGVVNIHSALWTRGDGFISDHNRYFDDIGVNGDGGYNHYELRYHKRQYTLPGVFEKGNLNPTMEYAENWIRDNPNF